MKAIKIYAQDSKFYMEDLDTNITTELTDIRQDPKGTGDYIVLPENSANRKFCKVKKAEAGITLDYKESKTFGPRNTDAPKTERKTKSNWTEYLTEDEQKIYDDLKAKCEARAARTQTENTITNLIATLDEDSRKALIATLMGGEA